MSATLSPLYLNQYTREVWSEIDAYIMAQLEPAIREGCYEPKIYKSPDTTQEVLSAGGQNSYVSHGLSITPGALWIGYIFPADFVKTEVLVQVTDVGLQHKVYSSPIPWYLIGNGKTDFPTLLTSPYPIVQPGRLLVEFWNVSGAQFRTQLQFLCLEPKR